MAVGKRPRTEQGEFWIATDDIPKTPAHPFYVRLNQLLDTVGMDDRVETLVEPYYAEKMGRPSLAPGVYFRLLLIGYFEGIDSERGIAWRVADSFALRKFLGYKLTETTPDHSTISKTRRRLPKEIHEEFFTMVGQLLVEEGLIKGKTIGIDASTMDANAALRSIVRRDTGEAYEEFLTQLAKESGIETPTREDLARVDKKRKKKGSNDDWENPHDPDAKITKTKDGRTHFAYKPENAIDLDTGAILAAEIHPANHGDTKTLPETLAGAWEELDGLEEDTDEVLKTREVVADKGTHSGPVLVILQEEGFRTYLSEPDRGRRRWTDKKGVKTEQKALEQEATYANRRRIKGERGKRLLRKRGELVERTFAHLLDTGGMRRTHLRGRINVAKRYLIQAAAFNLGLVMRKLIGAGKPRWAAASAVAHVFAFVKRLWSVLMSELARVASRQHSESTRLNWHFGAARIVRRPLAGTLSTGC